VALFFTIKSFLERFFIFDVFIIEWRCMKMIKKQMKRNIVAGVLLAIVIGMILWVNRSPYPLTKEIVLDAFKKEGIPLTVTQIIPNEMGCQCYRIEAQLPNWKKEKEYVSISIYKSEKKRIKEIENRSYLTNINAVFVSGGEESLKNIRIYYGVDVSSGKNVLVYTEEFKRVIESLEKQTEKK